MVDFDKKVDGSSKRHFEFSTLKPEDIKKIIAHLKANGQAKTAAELQKTLNPKAFHICADPKVEERYRELSEAGDRFADIVKDKDLPAKLREGIKKRYGGKIPDISI